MATLRHRCAHCGEPCGVTGHLRRGPGFCPSAPLVLVARARTDLLAQVEGDVVMGYACAPGHTCLTHGPAPEAQMSAPPTRRNWREDRPTHKQLEYLDALGYVGPRPVTKGQAHDLLEHIIKGSPLPEVSDARSRAYRLR